MTDLTLLVVLHGIASVLVLAVTALAVVLDD